MARLPEAPDTYLTTVRGMCRTCRKIVPARVAMRDGAVWQTALCPEHASAPACISGDAQAYLDGFTTATADRSPVPGATVPRQGCPHDCGPCTWHATPCQLPVISITNQCQLRCPICFTYNRREPVFHLPPARLADMVACLVDRHGPLDLINLTGGEPTLHPCLLEMIDCCRRPGIGRITLNTNGIRLAQEPDLAKALAEREVCVILSFDTLDPATSQRIHGADLVEVKRRAIEVCAAAGVRMTLLNVLIRGVNEAALADCLHLLREHDHILSLTVQTMTHTGQGGGQWPDRRHLPVDEAARMIADASAGQIRAEDFVPRPGAHPLCYRCAFALRDQQRLLPITRFADRERVMGLMVDSYLPRLERDPDLLKEGIDRLFVSGDQPALRLVRRLLDRCFPSGESIAPDERQRRAETAVRTIYVHAHMDEDTFDADRAMRCPDQVPLEDGRLVGACVYNLFERRRDPRFFAGD